MALYNLGDVTVVADGLDHPECVTVGPDGVVYAGGEAGQVYRIDPAAASVTQMGSTGGFALGLCLDGDGNIYICDPGLGAVMRMTPDGSVVRYSTLPMINPNYPVFDDDGTLFVTDSGRWHADDGRLFAVRPSGRAEELQVSVPQFPNGLALSEDGRWLYVAMSTLPGVIRLPVRGGHACGEPELVIEMPRAVPDGLALDVEGNLLIACYAPDVVYRLRPKGILETLVEDWERTAIASPTNVAFGGPNRTTLYVASLCRWHVSRLELDVPGLAYRYPRLA